MIVKIIAVSIFPFQVKYIIMFISIVSIIMFYLEKIYTGARNLYKNLFW